MTEMKTAEKLSDADCLHLAQTWDWSNPTTTAIARRLASMLAEAQAASIAGVWAQARENHRTYSDTGTREDDIRFLSLGLTGEAGELANFVKKRWRDGEGHDEAIRKEIADVCAYAFMLADTMGMAPADLIDVIADKQAVFIEKMKARDCGAGIGAATQTNTPELA